MSLVVLPGLDVVAGPRVPKARPFGRPGLRDELVGAELLVGEHGADVLGRGCRGTGGLAALPPAARRYPGGAKRSRTGGHPPERSP